MIPIPLEEEYRNMTRKELESKLMEMPQLEHTRIEEGLDHKGEIEEEPRDLHYDLLIESSMVYKDRFCLGGTNEEGEYMVIWYDSHEFLKCVNKEKLKEIKSKLIKTIKEIK